MKNSAVHIENLSVYYGTTPAITNVNMEVEMGEFLAIMGPNGGGKSTLLKSILGFVPSATGNIKIFGQDIKNNKTVVGYVPQFASMDRSFPITCLEVVLTGRLKKGLSPFHYYTKDDKAAAYEQLVRVGVDHLANRQVSAMSGGEFQKMLIARALTLSPRLLLLDEPTASVDVNYKNQIYNLLEELNKDITIIVVTHDLSYVSSKVRSLVCLNKNLIYHGEPEINEHTVKKLYGCPVDLIAHGVPHRVLGRHEEGKDD